jgi:predicted MFS family arabinose efflux permease
MKVFAAFGYRDFRLLWFGAFASTVGTWMQEVAQNWLILSLTGSAFFLGLDAFLGDVPILLFSLVGGVIADRVDRRKLLLSSQYSQMSFAFVLATLIYCKRVSIWHVLLLSFLTGSAQAFGGPAYQALVPTLVEKKDVTNAIALNSIQFNLARVVGPLAAGVTFAGLGAAACFVLNGFSFAAVIAALYRVRTTFMPQTNTQKVLAGLQQGLSYVRHQHALVALSFLAFCSTSLGIPLITLLPVFARDIFHLEAKGYSTLMAVLGCGAVIGALLVAAMGNMRQKGKVALSMQLMLGGLLVAFALSRNLGVTHAILFLGGMALVATFAMLTSLVQLQAPEEMRGRITSIYVIAFRGGMPIGSLVAGFFANQFSPTPVLVCNGLLLSLVGGAFLVLSSLVKEL